MKSFFPSLGGGKIFACRKDWCGCADCADRRHVNMLRGDDDKRAGGPGICIDERVGRDVRVVRTRLRSPSLNQGGRRRCSFQK